MLREKTVINDCYILQSQIGEDSFTEHWLATAIFSARRFILRFLKEGMDSADRVAILRADAVKSYRVRGPSISDFVELEAFENRLFISSEYDAETSLLRCMEAGKRWSLSQIANAAIALADGLSSFHGVGISYGNMNAESVAVIERGDQTPIVKIRKPSLIALLPLAGNNSHDLMESFAYLPPEWKRDGACGVAGDVFSVGMHLFRLFSGTIPYATEGAAIKASAPALRFVAVTLFTLGLPEDLVAIVVRSLLPAPEARFRSCPELIAALRAALVSLKSVAASEVGSASVTDNSLFERTDYFTASAGTADTAGATVGSVQKAATRLYPEWSANRAEASEYLTILSEESGWAVDEYIAFGLRTVYGESRARGTRPLGNYGAIELPREESLTVAAKKPPTEAVAPTVESVTTAISETENKPVIAIAPRVPVPAAKAAVLDEARGSGPEPFSGSSPGAKPEPIRGEESTKASDEIEQLFVGRDEGAIGIGRFGQEWTRHRIRVYDIKDIVARAAKRAESGRGSFRYIEEPGEYFAPNGLFDLLEDFSKRYLYINVGDCSRYGTADMQDFAEMLGKGIARALSKERDGSRRYLSRRLMAADSMGVLLSHGLCRALSLRPVIANPPINWRDGSILALLVECVRALSRKSRPLVIVIRGSENVSKDLHSFLSSLAIASRDIPVAVFAFFGRGHVEPWHALSRLSR